MREPKDMCLRYFHDISSQVEGWNCRRVGGRPPALHGARGAAAEWRQQILACPTDSAAKVSLMAETTTASELQQMKDDEFFLARNFKKLLR